MNKLAPNSSSFEVLERLSDGDYDKVTYHTDKATGLKVIVAIHDMTLGPALGGVRIWNYENESDALKDVLRLSRSMSYKSSMAGLDLGGGKAVIIGNPKKIKSEALLRSYGRFVDRLGGDYITGPDMNSNIEDMVTISKETNYVTTLPKSHGGGGDPSILTAYGTYLGMKAAAKQLYGNDSLKDKKILVQGVGKVGKYIVEHASKEGAKIYISDISKEALEAISKAYTVSIVEPSRVYDMDVDIYSPCALGAIINNDTIEKLKCKIIAGGANNQLEDEKKHDKRLFDKGILYVPDFVLNAGGLINASIELEGYNEKRAYKEVENIYNRSYDILKLSKSKQIPPQQLAISLAKERIQTIKNADLTYRG